LKTKTVEKKEEGKKMKTSAEIIAEEELRKVEKP